VLLGDLIEGVATDTAQPKAMVEAIVRAALARIEGAVGKRETVNLVGFGRFEVYARRPPRPQPADRRKPENSGHSGGALQNRQAPTRCRCRIETKTGRES
jgi:nucleoid DNA-binding protein